MRYLSFLGGKIIVKLLYKLLGISTVNEASVLDGLASGVRATKAMHSDLEEKLSGINVKIKNVADKGILCYYHVFNSFLWVKYLLLN